MGASPPLATLFEEVVEDVVKQSSPWKLPIEKMQRVSMVYTPTTTGNVMTTSSAPAQTVVYNASAMYNTSQTQ